MAVAQRVASITRPVRNRQEHSSSSEPIVGKDILELLSSAMYVDARTVYREYVQNAADAIDDAFATGLLGPTDLGRVDVIFDTLTRAVRIRDNGTGIPSSAAERVLTAFGASAKRGKGARGFRGVGRLAALGYAQSVSFKTKAHGEIVSTEVRWDCRKLKAALLDHRYCGDLKQIVKDVVTVVVEDAPDPSAHYFEVLLERVVRIKNDVLLNTDEISRYLGEVAPAPFHSDFPFADEIAAKMRVHVAPCRFRIFVDGSTSPITRPHRAEFAVTSIKSDRVTDIEYLEIPDGDGGLRAVGWLLHHGYLGAIHASEELRGLRARVGDIQIGTGDLFSEAFKEHRFNSWTIGEIHVLDPRVVPNGRRDCFEQTDPYSALLTEVVLIARNQASRCRQSSTRRNRLRGFETRDKKVQELFALLGARGLTRSREIKIRSEIGSEFHQMKRLSRSPILPDDDQRRLERRLSVLETKYRRFQPHVERADPFANLEPGQRRAYAQMIEFIYDCSTTRVAATVLVEKIMARLVAQRGRNRGLTKRRAPK